MIDDLTIIDDSQVDDTSRRNFLKHFGSALAGITIVGSIAPLLESCYSSGSNATGGSGSDAGKTLAVDVSSLTTDKMAFPTSAPVSGRPLLIIRLSATNYETLLMICKHMGCEPPNLAFNGTQINCACHGSQYDINGNVIQGPTTAPLDKFATAFDAASKKVTISF
ncbi:MAG TPA: Rieske 2Fe-2S domain-containing protein [Candidatus Kapabacteria bacterium]|nr:Rieske 2Fe-2S domain-containing protein [Candidatus Kapabacteria bacterium]